MTVRLAAGCGEELARYCHAWERHGVRFGITGAHHRLEGYGEMFTAMCGTPEGMEGGGERVVLLSGVPGMVRFPYGYPDRSLRGRVNPRFLDAAPLLRDAPHLFGRKDWTLVLPVAPFSPAEGIGPPEFVQRLRRFLDALPAGGRTAVQVGNGRLLVPDYFALLRDRGVTHVAGDGVDMPDLFEQILHPGIPTAGRVIIRAAAPRSVRARTLLCGVIRRCLGGGTPATLLLEDPAELSARALLPVMEELNGDLACRSVLRRRAA